jgi:transglutaminase-like putative cysteine protease
MITPEKKSIFWVIASLSAAMAPQIIRMPLALIAITLFPMLWRIGAERYDWKELPPLIRHAATASALLILFFSYGNVTGRRAAVSLLTVMLALKLIESYRIRDARLIVSFSLFLCATQFLFSQNILMPFYGAVCVIIALVALTQLQRNEAFEHLGETPPVHASIFSELGFSFRLLALAIPVGLAFFLFFPRWATPLWGIPETTLDSKTGLSGSMSPGSIQSLFMDDSPAFRVEFEGGIPRPSELYWRGPVFWNFDGKTWSGSFFGKNITAKSRPDREGAPWRYTVQLEPNERHWLFALDYPVTTPLDSRVSMDFQILRREAVTQLLQYSMVSNPDFTDTPELSVELQASALDLPNRSNPRARELIGQWQEEGLTGQAMMQRVLDYFNQEAFYYSLDSPLLGEHSVDEFLFDTRTGYCEHYASSFTVLMRMAGIPARVVTGYQGGWYNPIGEYLLIRQSDAHAWAEVWFPGTGWTRVDPTAAVSPARVSQGSLGALSSPRHMLDYTWLRNLRNGVDVVQQRWNDWVIEFGASSQAKMFSPLGLDRMTPTHLVLVMFAAIGLFSVILLPFILRTKGPGRKDPLQVAWQLFLKRLQLAGIETQASDGPIELAQAAALNLPGDAQSIYRIADLYSRYRYARIPPPLGEIKSAIKEFHPKKSAA